MRKLILCFVLLTGAMIVQAQESKPILKPALTDSAITVDGILSEEVWKEAPFINNFTTFEPDIGKDMGEETIIRLAYDKKNIYIAFECFDSQANTIKYSVSNRDNAWSDDLVAIWIDSFFDQQKGFGVWINPLGIQNDAMFTTTEFDPTYDAVLYSKGIVHSDRYTLEVQIPFKSLRYENKDVVEMGIMFMRSVRRTSEKGTYPALGTSSSSSILLNMAMVEFKGIEKYKLLEIIPAVSLSQKGYHVNGVWKDESIDKKLSLTAKYGFSSKLILEGTYNPDFSQVEADAGQVDVNLRYDLFYPEKRPFFLEGKEDYFLAVGNESDHNHPLQSLVHTRRILEPAYGAKFTGKVGKSHSVSTLYARDIIPAINDTTPNPKGNNIDYYTFRYKISTGDNSYLGSIYTDSEFKTGYSRLGGLDWLYMLNQYNYFKAHLFGAWNKNINGVYNGYAYGADYFHYSRRLILGVSMNNIDKDFYSDLGYVTRTGITRLSTIVNPRIYPESEVFQLVDLIYSGSILKDNIFDLYEISNGISARLSMPRNTSLTTGINISNETFAGKKFNTNHVYTNGSSQITNKITASFYYRFGNLIYYSDNPYQGWGTYANASLGFDLFEKINNTIDFTYSNFYRETDSKQMFDYIILRNKLTYNLNRYFFLRSVVEYNSYRDKLLTDFLLSFTYIPGTVLYLGYGSLYNKTKWDNNSPEPQYIKSNKFMETERGFFFKVSYLFQYK